jgi:hypothetical protein
MGTTKQKAHYSRMFATAEERNYTSVKYGILFFKSIREYVLLKRKAKKLH